MANSKILLALEAFKAEYGWDKSLVGSLESPPAAAPLVCEAQHFDPLLRFQELSNGRRSE